MTTALDAFEASCSRVDAAVTRTTTDDAAGVLATLLEPPAVAVELPYEGITLRDTGDPTTGGGADLIVDPTPKQLRAARTGITPASGGVTDYGSILLRCTGDGAEFVALYPDRHIAVVRASEIEADMQDAIDAIAPSMRDEAADFVVATGPSATADMGRVVQGVHGPSEVHIVVLEDA